MKKKQVKTLSLQKKSISNLKSKKVTMGGSGSLVMCSFNGPCEEDDWSLVLCSFHPDCMRY
jgi:hypothetical protein